jgi:predicted DNA-binding protein (MmcQ/YjbR family)
MATKREAELAAAFKALQSLALGLPEATEDYPWEHTVWKVKGKVFCFSNQPGDELGFTVKLPHSSGAALMLPFVQMTGYGLGRSGWVTARFDGRKKVPLALLEAWLLESYRAVAPKKLASRLIVP